MNPNRVEAFFSAYLGHSIPFAVRYVFLVLLGIAYVALYVPCYLAYGLYLVIVRLHGCGNRFVGSAIAFKESRHVEM